MYINLKNKNISTKEMPQDLASELHKLCWIRLQFCMKAEQEGRLSLFIGSAIRGAIGPRLEIIFGKSFHNNSIPQFTIDIEFLKKREIRKNDLITWSLILFGDQRSRLKEILYVLKEPIVLGGDKIPFTIEHITPYPGIQFQPQDGQIGLIPCQYHGDAYLQNQRSLYTGTSAKLEFLTPLRLTHKGHLLKKFEPDIFFRRLWERITVYTSNQIKEKGNHISIPHFEGLTAQGNMGWMELERHSSSQARKNNLSGLKGRVEIFPMNALLWDLIRLGEVLHVGSKIAFGLGRYRIL